VIWRALALVCAVPAVLAAQSPLYPSATGGLGPEIRIVSFEPGIGLKRAAQSVVRLFGGVPLGRRLFLDLGSDLAITRLEASDGTRVSLNGLTDTQVRASYTVGRDQVVASLLLNVPTGTEQVQSDQLPLVRSIAQNFLPFPVSSYGSGLGLTGALAVAQRLGSWSLGAAGSMRYLASYSPFADIDSRYAPGLESRIRLGVRRSLGPTASVMAGVTLSSFGADEFSGVQNYTYRPGQRVVVETALSRQIGRSTARLFGWAFFRAAGDSSGVVVAKAREHIWYGGANATVPLVGRLSVDPGLDGRSWLAADGAHGRLAALSLGARMPLGSRLLLASTARVERGTITLAEGAWAGFTAVGLSVFLRVGS
jgi:hypothetical protein